MASSVVRVRHWCSAPFAGPRDEMHGLGGTIMTPDPRSVQRRPSGTTVSMQVVVEAPADVVWQVLAHPPSWPAWTASMTSVEILGAGALRRGAAVRIRQPRLPVMVWRVVSWRPGESFVWTTASPGVRTVGTHAVVPASAGRSHLVLGIYHHGPLAPLVRVLTGRLTRRYVALEAAGHKAAAEGTAA
jgi:hypothetical protein